MAVYDVCDFEEIYEICAGDDLRKQQPPARRLEGKILIADICGFSCMTRTNALTVLPHSVVFAYRKERSMTALPFQIPHPNKSLGILRLANAPYLPAVDKYAHHVAKSFENLRHLIKRHEDAVVWGG